jgi:hypothetical protein
MEGMKGVDLSQSLHGGIVGMSGEGYHAVLVIM